MPGQLAANITALALWLWLFRPVLAHLGRIYARQDMSVSLVALLAILAALLWRARGRRPTLAALARAPEPRALPALTALGAALAYLATARLLDVNILEDALFAVASYGLLGLWMAPSGWRRGWPVLLLAVATLPFGYHLDTFVGYPLRVWTASMASSLLGARLPAGGGAEAVLLLENQAAAVDLPCSGVKGLWTGGLLLLAGAWLGGVGVGWRLAIAAAGQTVLLIAANLARVVILAWVGLALGQPIVAGWLHLPLGVLGFGAAAWLGLWLLGTRGDAPESGQVDAPRAATASRPPSRIGAASAALLVAILGLNLAYRPRPTLAAPVAASTLQGSSPWAWPAGLAVEPQPLEAADAAWLASDGADAVERVRFRRGELSGSLILVRAATWRAHHAPERCFQVYGLRQLDSRPVVLDGGALSLRHVALGGAAGGATHTALYWFQSAGGRVTGDYATRIWADLSPRREPWVLASVLFDRPVDAGSAAVLDLARALRRTIGESWKGATS